MVSDKFTRGTNTTRQANKQPRRIFSAFLRHARNFRNFVSCLKHNFARGEGEDNYDDDDRDEQNYFYILYVYDYSISTVIRR